EEMADVDQRDPACRQAPDQCEEALHLLALKAAGRLVHQEDARVPRQGAADLHHLPRGEGQLRHAAVGIQLRAAEVAQESEPAPSVRSTPSSASVAANRLATSRIRSTLIAR